MKTIKLQNRTLLEKTNYLQHRINIPNDVIKRLGWNQEDQIVLNINNEKKIITLELKTDNI